MIDQARAGPGGPSPSIALPGDGRAAQRVADGESAGRIEFANTLRGVAAAMVLFGHIAGVYWIGKPAVVAVTGVEYVPSATPGLTQFVWTGFGAYGVALFFVISGFVIPFSIERYGVKAFVVGRLFRIWPTCWMGLTVTVLSVLIGVHFMGGVVPFTFRDAITHFFPPFAAIADSKQIDWAMWTLEIEMMFYVVCAIAAKQLRDGGWTLWLAPAAVFLFWLGMDQLVHVLRPTHPDIARRLYYFAFDPIYIVFMFCGVALNLRQRGKLGAVSTAFAVAACLALFAWAQRYGHMPIAANVPAYAAGLATFMIAMALQRFFHRWPVTSFFADISFPLYIVHGVAGFMLLHAMMRAGWPPDLAVIVTMALAIVAAWLIHKAVEMPTHRIGQRLARRLSRPAPSLRTAPVGGIEPPMPG